MLPLRFLLFFFLLFIFFSAEEYTTAVKSPLFIRFRRPTCISILSGVTWSRDAAERVLLAYQLTLHQLTTRANS